MLEMLKLNPTPGSFAVMVNAPAPVEDAVTPKPAPLIWPIKSFFKISFVAPAAAVAVSVRPLILT